MRTSKNHIRCMKAKGIINHSVDDIMKTFLDNKYEHHYNKGYAYSEIVETIIPDDKTFIFYQTTKKYLVVHARDFLAVHHRVKHNDGSTTVTVFSINREDLRPTKKSIVRMWLHLGCWKFEPINPNQTLCTYVVEIDLRANAPNFIANQINKDVGYQISRLEETVNIYLRDHNQQKIT